MWLLEELNEIICVKYIESTTAQQILGNSNYYMVLMAKTQIPREIASYVIAFFKLLKI